MIIITLFATSATAKSKEKEKETYKYTSNHDKAIK